MRRLAAVLFAIVAGLGVFGTIPALAGSNLVANGSFDNSGDQLYGWKYKYDLQGESWYFKNHEYVAVVPQDGAQKNVLVLTGNYETLQVPGQGVKVDSWPIQVKPGGRYKISARARSTGPDCRILVEGYQWKPGVKPHDKPELHELRKCFKGVQVFFGEVKAGTSGSPGSTWQRSSQTFPKEKISDLEKQLFDKAEFMVIHIVAIKGSEGKLYVDDVELERLN